MKTIGVLSLMMLMAFYSAGCGGKTPSPPVDPTGGPVIVSDPPATPTVVNGTVNPQIVSDVKFALSEATQLALLQFQKDSPDTVKVVATQMNANLQDVSAYLKGGTLDLSGIEMNLFKTKLFKNMPPIVYIAVSAASGILTRVGVIPSADKVINPIQLAYMQASVDGIVDGLQAFTDNKPSLQAKGKSLLFEK